MSAGHLFVSPHLDDAVFACGEWIVSSPSSIVVTIFAGAPPAGAALTSWDAECGFRDGDATQTIADTLASVIARAPSSAIHFPLGLFHRDHVRASDACVMLVDRLDAYELYVYEDALYRRIIGAVDERMNALREHGLDLARCAPALARDAQSRKREAVACYRSQLRGLRTHEAYDDIDAPEAHWGVRSRSRR